MKHTLQLASAVALGCLVLSGSGTATGKPVSDTIGTAVFRCDATSWPPCVTDRILGDGGNYLGFGVADTGYGTHLDAPNEMWIGVRSGYHVSFDFSEPEGLAPCASTSNCRRWTSEASWPILTTEADIHSNVLLDDTFNEVEAPNGLLDVPETQTRRARFNIAFPDPEGRNLVWRLNFRTYDYPDATNLNVKRTNECTWEFEPGVIDGVSDQAGLSSWGNIGKGKNTRTNEGLFKMPFKITFQIPGCVP